MCQRDWAVVGPESLPSVAMLNLQTYILPLPHGHGRRVKILLMPGRTSILQWLGRIHFLLYYRIASSSIQFLSIYLDIRFPHLGQYWRRVCIRPFWKVCAVGCPVPGAPAPINRSTIYPLYRHQAQTTCQRICFHLQ